MIDAALDLQQAIFKALRDDQSLSDDLGGASVFDRVPERVAPPYIVLGRSAASDWSTATEDGTAVIFFVHVWSDKNSRSQCHGLQAHVKRILSGPVPALEFHQLINLRFQLAETRRDRINDRFHGLLRFRAVTEPIT